MNRIRLNPKLDRRPWVILSLREVSVLVTYAVRGMREAPEDLRPVLRVVKQQLEYIRGTIDEHEPDVSGALEREYLWED